MLQISEIFEFFLGKNSGKFLFLKEFEWFEWFEWFGPSPIEPFNPGQQGVLRGSTVRLLAQASTGTTTRRPAPYRSTSLPVSRVPVQAGRAKPRRSWSLTDRHVRRVDRASSGRTGARTEYRYCDSCPRAWPAGTTMKYS